MKNVLEVTASAETLLEVARDLRLLGAELGFFSVLHTWSQQLCIHPHVHCVIPAGCLSPDHTRWIRSREKYFLPKKVLREAFRGKFTDALKQAFQDLMSTRNSRRLAFEGIQDVHGKVSEIALVPSGHGEAMNACRGGNHPVLTQSLGTAVH